MIISNVAIRNRVTIAVLVVLIALLGGYAYVTLPQEAAPDVPIPYVMVSTTYEGVAPEDVESAVTMKIEKKLSGLKGVKEVRSSSSEGQSLIIVEFLPDIRIEDALQYVRDKVDQAKSELPSEAEDPVIGEINVAELPIFQVAISGDTPVRLKAIADELEDRFEEIPGVLNADVIGGPEREIRLEIDQDRLTAFGLTIPEILRLIPTENVNISAGGLETPGTRFNVRVPAEFVTPEQIDHLLLAEREGRPIYLSDVAKVCDTFKDPVSYSRLNGLPSITIAVQKRVGADIVAIARTVKAMLAEARNYVPQDVEFTLTLDRSEDIARMVADLENTIGAALVLVVAVLLVFMGLRAAVVVALAVPLSMLLSFAILSALGYTLNMIVLFSLVLAVGMLVDNAIVIVENIYRHRQLGMGRIEAATKGTAEVAWPVITSTATTVAAFAPLLFWPGIMGDFMKYLPATVIVVLTSSLFVAMVISPVVTILVGAKARKRQGQAAILKGYRKVLSVAINHRLTTLGLAVALLAGLGMLYKRLGRGLEFFPDVDPKNAVVNIRAPQGTNINRSDDLALTVEKQLGPYLGRLNYVVANVGTVGGKGTLFGGAGSGPHMGNITLVFPDFVDRKVPSAEIVTAVRDQVADIAGAEIKVEKEEAGPPTGAEVTVEIIGRDFQKLQELSENVRKRIIDVPGLVDLRSDLEATRPELVFNVDRQKAMLSGVNTQVIGNFLKTSVFGSKVSTYRQYNDEYDITVRLPEYQRNRIDDLLRLHVLNDAGEAVPLTSLGDFEYTGGFGTINRINQKRVVTLTGDAEGRLAEEVLRDVRGRLNGLALPSGYEIKFAGKKEEQDKAQAFLSKAFVVALLLIVLVLVAQFNTLSVPLVVMATVVLSLIGVMIGLLAMDMPFGVVMTGIGVISLAGVVVNNAIVLLDFTRQLQRRGMDVVAAAVEAGVTRLRPVLLTAVTTVAGLLPTLLGMGFDFHTFQWVTRSESSQWWRGMAVAVVFGLSFATILTLVVVPSLYVAVYRLAARLGFGGLRDRMAQSPAAEASAPVPPQAADGSSPLPAASA